MTSLRMLLAALLPAALASCGARSALLGAGSGGGSGGSGGAAGLPVALDSTPLRVDTHDDVAYAEPEDMGRPAWAGDRFGITWVHYAAAGISLRMTTVHREAGKAVLDPPVTITADNDLGAPGITWDGQAFAVYWVLRGTLRVQRLDRDRNPLGPPLVVAADLGPHATPLQVIHDAGLDDVLLLDDRASSFSYAPFLLQVSAAGAVVGGELQLLPADPTTQVGGIAARAGQLHLVWARVPSDGTATVSYVSSFPPGGPVGAPVQVYSGLTNEPRAGSIVAEAARLDLGVLDFEHPPLLVQLAPDQNLATARLPAGTDALDLALAAGDALGGLTGTGVYQPDNPAPTTLLFQGFAGGQPAGPPLVLDPTGASGGVLLEKYALAGGSGTFAALWLDDTPVGGQPNRALYFAEVAAR